MRPGRSVADVRSGTPLPDSRSPAGTRRSGGRTVVRRSLPSEDPVTTPDGAEGPTNDLADDLADHPADDGEAELLAEHAASARVEPGVQAALQVAVTWVGDDVHLVGAGVTDDGTPCVVVHASVRAELPEAVEGVPVRIVLDDQVMALDAGDVVDDPASSSSRQTVVEPAD